MSITAIRALVDAQPVSNKLAYDIKAILNKMDALPDVRTPVPVAAKTNRGRKSAKVAGSPEEQAKLEEKRRKDRERKAAKKAQVVVKAEDI